MSNKPAHYLEVQIEGRTCFIKSDDLRILYGLAGHVTGQRKSFEELPRDALIARAVVIRKRSMVRFPKWLKG